jgi:hypothetical protein
MIYALCDFSSHSDELVQSIKSHDPSHNCKLIISEFFNEFRDEDIVSISIKGITDDCKNTFVDDETKFEFDNDFEWIIRASQRFMLKKIAHNEVYFQLIRMYAYLKSLLKINNIDVLFFGISSPHHLYNQLLAIAAKNLSINVFVTYSHEILGENKVILINYFTRKPVLTSEILARIELNNEKLELQNYFNESYGLNKSAIAKEFLDLERNKLKHILVISRFVCEFLLSLFFIRNPKGSSNTLGTVLPQSYYHEFYVRKKIVFGWVEQIRYRNKYKKNAVNPETPKLFERPYVIFLAPQQPEATSIPDAFKLSDVNLVMQKIIHDFAGKYEIFYQEHPGNFQYVGLINDQIMGTSSNDFRNIDYLEYYLSNNVKLIYPNVKYTNLLIRNAIAVFSVNGSSLLQGVLFNKPTFNFGKFWVDLNLGIVEATYNLNLVDQLRYIDGSQVDNLDVILNEFAKIRISAFPNFTGANTGKKESTIKSDAFIFALNSESLNG